MQTKEMIYTQLTPEKEPGKKQKGGVFKGRSYEKRGVPRLLD